VELSYYRQLTALEVRSKSYPVCRCGRAFEVTRTNKKTCRDECRKLRPKRPTVGTRPSLLGAWGDRPGDERRGFLVRLGGEGLGSASREVEFGIDCPDCGSFDWVQPGQRYCRACRSNAATAARCRSRAA
jgi:hypothetical protein